MSDVSISKIARSARKPWYAAWNWIESRFYAGREYTLQVPFGRRVLTPWFDESEENEFAKLVGPIRRNRVLTASLDRTYMLYQLVRRASRLPGDVAECGVYKGASAYVIAATLAKHRSGAQLDLFDTFDGVPDMADPKRDYTKPGSFSDTSVERVKARLQGFLTRCRFHAGLIPDTFADVPHQTTYSVVNVDVDLYPTTRHCCEWFWPRMVEGGVMVFNDYGFYPYRNSTRRAVDEFFAGLGELPLVLPTGQAVAIKGSPSPLGANPQSSSMAEDQVVS